LTDADVRLAPAGKNGYSICQSKTVTEPLGYEGTVNIRCGLPYGPPFHPELPLRKALYVVLGSERFPEGEIRGQIKINTLDFDVDGDGKTDPFLYRTKDACSYALCSVDDDTMEHQFEGAATDSQPFLADFDGDGIADHSFIRNFAAGTARVGPMTVIYVRSSDNTFRGIEWGHSMFSDQPVRGDFDGDGKTDVAVFRPTDGIWYILQSSNDQPRYEYWGTQGDRACSGDFDKDGKADLCILRDEAGLLAWYIRRSSDNEFYKVNWGLATDTVYLNNPVDIDRDGATDILVSREENGVRTFYGRQTSDAAWFVLQWGFADDAVKLGDFDGDGKTDFAALRKAKRQMIWYIWQSSDTGTRVLYWGLPDDN
jgi:hypothetical protein